MNFYERFFTIIFYKFLNKINDFYYNEFHKFLIYIKE